MFKKIAQLREVFLLIMGKHPGTELIYNYENLEKLKNILNSQSLTSNDKLQDIIRKLDRDMEWIKNCLDGSIIIPL